MSRLIDFLFPPQCAACNAIGSGLCSICLPPAMPLRRYLATLDVVAVGEYHGALRRGVVSLKGGRRDVCAALAERLALLCNSSSVLVPVPTTAARRRVRGMDNVVQLAEHAARRSGGRLCSALRRTGADAQRGRNREARLAARGRFICDASMLASQRVVLVDDVCTTGATLEDCAAIVRAAGGMVEEAVVIALA